MSRIIDADALYEKTAEWEASALAYIEELNREPLWEMDEDEKAEWRRWTAILGERSAFKHDVADAPTIDAVEVVRCGKCRHYQGNHDVPGCAPCDFWGIGGVMWDDFCKRGEMWDE